MLDRVRQGFRERLHSKHLAYVRTFCGDNGRLHLSGERVLADLKRFCGINRAGIVVSPITRTVDSHATAYQAGLRDAFLHITKVLDVDPNEIEEEPNNAKPTDDG
jgi:hypothetical protein